MPPLSPTLIAGFIAGVIPFFFFCGTSSVRTVNGEVVSSNSFNVLALAGGIIAIAAAGREVLDPSLRANQSNRTLSLALAAALAVLGIVQLVRAFGIF